MGPEVIDRRNRSRRAEDRATRTLARVSAGSDLRSLTAALGSPDPVRVRERLGWNLRYPGFARRKILGLEGSGPFGVRNSEFGIRSSESILPQPLSGPLMPAGAN